MDNNSFIDVTSAISKTNNRNVFVAYSYRQYPKDDYRKIYTELEKAFSVKFVFADEKTEPLHILQKIANDIGSSKFSIFDISGWNPNVTLELGLAIGMNRRCYLAFNPQKTNESEVPSDLKGIDRIEYTSYSELSQKLINLLRQEFPKEEKPKNAKSYLDEVEDRIENAVNENNGIGVATISKVIDENIEMVKVAMKPLLINKRVISKGNKRGTKYYPAK